MSRTSRREFLRAASGATAGGLAGVAAAAYAFSGEARAATARRDRPRVGCIAVGDRWQIIGPEAMKFGDVVAVCDVDRKRVAAGQQVVLRTQDRLPEAYEDYRRLLDRADIDVVTIATPDHWHAKIAIEAMKAGKDVYCEKPLALTIDEGKKICQVVDQTRRVFQVGTTQRSEIRGEFIKAVALVRDGRIGKVRKVTCVIGGSHTSAKLHKVPAPDELNWEMWLGQAPLTDYLGGGPMAGNVPQGRAHYEFRWWYEYSGGKMTDWGAHHVDIAHWAIGAENTGPVSVAGTAEFPVPLKDGMPTESDRYNTAHRFAVSCTFADGVVVEILSEGRNSITFEGDQGKFVVGRGRLAGKPVEELLDRPLPAGLITQLCKGKRPGNHMGNFFECVADRGEPVSDARSNHRALTTCHLANIAIRLGRRIQWDPASEEIVGDPLANSFLARQQRKGYEVVA